VISAFRHEEMRTLLRGAASGRNDAAQKVWLLVILEHWLRAWNADLN
jgi:hypothetical protein